MKAVKIIAGFAILFLLYHTAEYMIVFKNSPMGFLGIQVLFFIAAWLIAKWQKGKGLSAWGMDGKASLFKHLLPGMLMGVVLYGVSFSISLALGAEKIITTPSLSSALMPIALFVFGNFFSSFSEDILTRGYVYYHSKGSIIARWIVLLSATIYLLNHIYRLKDGAQAWIYLFLLGVLYVLPLLFTKRLWFTGGMHWAGNCTFFITHEVIKTDSVPGKIDANFIFVGCIIVFIPFVYFLLKSFGLMKYSVVKTTYKPAESLTLN
ncbi:MAG: hypothetical protein C4329_15675 [Chitinophagaceae bacterium]